MKMGRLRVKIECKDKITPILNVIWVMTTIMWLLEVFHAKQKEVSDEINSEISKE